MKETEHSTANYYDVVIIGAGSAGIGMGILLEKLQLSYILLEKTSIGASFKKWP